MTNHYDIDAAFSVTCIRCGRVEIGPFGLRTREMFQKELQRKHWIHIDRGWVCPECQELPQQESADTNEDDEDDDVYNESFN